MGFPDQPLQTPRAKAAILAGSIVFALAALGFVQWPILPAAVGAGAVIITLLWASAYTRQHPKWLLFALILIEALPSASLIDDSIRPWIRYSLLLCFAAPAFAKTLRSGVLLHGGFGLYSIYFALAAFSVTYSIEPMYSAGRVMGSVVLFGAVCAIASEAKDEADVRDLFRIGWTACAVVVAFLGVALLAFPAELAWPPSQFGSAMPRFAGIFGSPNQVGEIMLATVAAGLLYWPAASARMRKLIAMTLLASVCFGIVADSRSAFVALGIGLSIAAMRAYGWRGAFAVSAAMLLVISAVAISGEEVRSYFLRGEVGTLTGRTEVWNYVARQIWERSLLGYGFETEGQLFQSRYFPLWAELWNMGPHSSIHSGYLARAAGVGIPATLLWMFLIARPFAAMLRAKCPRPDLKNAVLIAAIPVLILSIVESTGGDCRDSVGLLLTLVWCLAERARLSSEKNREWSNTRTGIPAWEVRRIAHQG